MEEVKIVVVGDRGVGKTSIITTLVSDDFIDVVPPTIPPVLITKKGKDNVKTEIIDTSSKIEDQQKVDEVIKKADFVCIVYNVNDPETLKSVETKWLVKILEIRGKIPVALLGNKIDLLEQKLGRKRTAEETERDMMPIMQRNEIIEFVLECTTKDKDSISSINDLFSSARHSAAYPRLPLCDIDIAFTTEFSSTLQRLFLMADKDRDGYLDNEELKLFQKQSFIDDDLDDESLKQIQILLKQNDPNSMYGDKLTLNGFESLFRLILERGRTETIWTILRNYGYNNNLKLNESYTNPQLQKLGQSSAYELSNIGEDFILSLFPRNKKVFTQNQFNNLFKVVPDEQKHPWSYFGFPNCCEVINSDPTSAEYGVITDKAWLSLWKMLTFYNPKLTLHYLACLGFVPNEQNSANPFMEAIEPRRDDSRTVFTAYVFGLDYAKNNLLNFFLNKKSNQKSEKRELSEDDAKKIKYAVNTIERKNCEIILEAVGEEKKTIESRPKMAKCDLALFIYDKSKVGSLDYNLDLVNQTKKAIPKLPCVLVSVMSNSTESLEGSLPPEKKYESLKSLTFLKMPKNAQETTPFILTLADIIKASKKPRSRFNFWNIFIGSILFSITAWGIWVGGNYYYDHHTFQGIKLNDFIVPIQDALEDTSNRFKQLLTE